MAVDTPARIVILGGGPIGLEAGLYARFLGYEVEILERGRVGQHVLGWGHVRMFTPFGRNRSTLGLAALAAQDADYRPPSDDEVLAGRDWVRRYLEPLSQTDLLAESVRLQATVIAVGRRGMVKGDPIDGELRAESSFRILVQDGDGRQRDSSADIVIDATGVYGEANWAGEGGAPAIGETALRTRIEYGIPDVLSAQRSRYAGKQILLLGSDLAAAATATALADLARQVAGTRVTWVTPDLPDGSSPDPIPWPAADTLPARARLVADANRLPREMPQVFVHWPASGVQAVAYDEASDRWTADLCGEHAGQCQFDRVIANVGYRPDTSLSRELQVEHSWLTESPVSVQPPADGWSPVNPEPNFYVLGAKSFGRRSDFLFSTGLEQIRQLFALIGDRADLDLYAGARRLLK